MRKVKGTDNNIGKIKAIVATKQTQGCRNNDFCDAPENEPVRLGRRCEKCTVGDIDGPCDCVESFNGFHKGSTTTVKIALVEMTREQYIEKYIDTHPLAKFYVAKDGCKRELKKEAEGLLLFADKYETGTVFGFFLGAFISRDTIKGKNTKPKFDLGEVKISEISKRILDGRSILSALKRHRSGDWGHVPDINALQNDYIAKNGGPGAILSQYYDSGKKEFWIYTDTLRGKTLVIVPDKE